MNKDRQPTSVPTNPRMFAMGENDEVIGVASYRLDNPDGVDLLQDMLRSPRISPEMVIWRPLRVIAYVCLPTEYIVHGCEPGESRPLMILRHEDGADIQIIGRQPCLELAHCFGARSYGPWQPAELFDLRLPRKPLSAWDAYLHPRWRRSAAGKGGGDGGA